MARVWRVSAAVGLIGALVLVLGLNGKSASSCETGEVQGYALVTGTRLTGPGGIPSRFTNAQRYFGRRYNCTGRLVQVRRVDDGSYIVRFPGNRAVAALADSATDDGSSSSSVSLGGGQFQVRILGPGIERNVLEPRDTPFVIAVF